ncbi:hypothetical protein EJD97_003365 [Solanum chilense]|uniref:Uncharacterized protein n=1 Tax=Solanum chilense TaxID=4083 RepID=A0A6N2C2U7_SOLCI|nr:hypothetical protein EJD97_003365 [Solanum chilense]
MNTRRTPARRVEENDVNEKFHSQVKDVEQVPQGVQGDQVPIEGQGNEVPVVPLEMTNGEIREALLSIARALTTHPTCATYGKKHYGKCLARTSGLCGCGKDYHKVRYFPTIAFRGREGKEVAPNVSKDDAQNKRRFYALRTSGSKPNDDDE